MNLRVKLLDGEVLAFMDVDPKVWTKTYRRAMRRKGLVEMENERGELLAINPHQVQFVEFVGDTGDANDRPPLRMATVTPS
jgi:hypothetical protein